MCIRDSITPPPPPVEVKEVAALEASSILKENSEIRLLDVRTQHERETASLDNSALLDQELVEEILGSWDQNTPLMFFATWENAVDKQLNILPHRVFNRCTTSLTEYGAGQAMWTPQFLNTRFHNFLLRNLRGL